MKGGTSWGIWNKVRLVSLFIFKMGEPFRCLYHDRKKPIKKGGKEKGDNQYSGVPKQYRISPREEGGHLFYCNINEGEKALV